jgi:hypothetical protein
MNSDFQQNLNTEKIIRYFADNVLALTGINIPQQDIEVVVRTKTLLIRAWQCTVAQVSYLNIPEDAYDKIENAIVMKAVQQVGDLRRKIIKCKIEHLNRSIPEWAEEVKQTLRAQNVSETFVNSLKFTIVNHGYRFKQYTTYNEKIYDYPYLSIHISNEDQFTFSYPINVYNTLDPIEMEELKDNLFMAVLEQAINRKSDLDKL